ncbi:MAG: ABC transporter substrate-binding protein, partial [Thermoplasmata archaeon]|nr:ABC transporter substrate-binding protein [Thermoplasmata archaeon]
YFWWAGDYYAFTTDSNGEATVIATTNPLMADQPVYVDAWVDPGIGGDIWLGAGFPYPYLFGVKEGFVLTRAPIMAISSFNVDKPYLSESDLSADVTLTVVDKNGPLANVDVSVEWSIGEYSDSTTVTTGSDGKATFSMMVPPQIADGIVTLSVLLSSADHAMGLNYEFGVPYLQGAMEMKNLIVMDSATITPNPISNEGTGTLTFKFIGGLMGKPVVGKEVRVDALGGTFEENIKTTDSNGEVTFTYNAPANLVAQQYPVVVSVENGPTYVVPLAVQGEYANTGEVSNKISQLTDQLNELQSNYDTLNSDYNQLKSDYDSLQSDYKKVKDEKSSATTMEYVFLVLFIIFLILTPVMYIVGKKQGAPKTVEEETVEEPTEEEETEEIEEETSEETSEEEKEE